MTQALSSENQWPYQVLCSIILLFVYDKRDEICIIVKQGIGDKDFVEKLFKVWYGICYTCKIYFSMCIDYTAPKCSTIGTVIESFLLRANTTCSGIFYIIGIMQCNLCGMKSDVPWNILKKNV